ncbi:SRPBCC domain-containing protein [Actinopolymorpha sp. NPDC004070]|uniref:SRPBCC family protein n=1 Tax=Actinopolymorpha sp. NPDC004070 TaxID=3154548 RepID=UPI0033A6E541
MAENGYTYTLTRTLDAPVAKVWEAWTNPEQYAQWANAVPGSVEMHVRPGGTWKATMVTPGGEFPLGGTYLEVADKRRLVLGMNVPGRPEPVAMSADFTDLGERSEITVSQTSDTKEERDMAEQGSTMLLDGLSKFVANS